MHAPLAMNYRTEWQPFAALASIAEEWRELAARAIEPNVFYEPAFALPAADVFGRKAGAILVRAPSGKLAGLFPMQLGRAGLIKSFVHSYAPLGSPLIDRADPDGIVNAWLTHLTKANRAVLLPLVPEGPFAEALARVCDRRNLSAASFAAYDRALLAPGEDRSRYLDGSAGSKGSKSLLRRRRRLAEQRPLTHRAVRGAEMKDFVAAFLTLEASGWKGRSGTAAQRDAEISSFFQTSVTSLAAEGKAQGEMLLLDDTPIAAMVVLRSGDSAWAWKIAYDERYASFSPGVQVALDATRTLLEDKTIDRTDSCTAPGPHMIDRLWRERLALSDRLISLRPGPSLYFSGLRTFATMRRMAISTAKSLLRR